MKPLTPWIIHESDGTNPAFFDADMVEVKYRDGRVSGPENLAHSFAGWNHTGSRNDIVEYRVFIKRIDAGG